MKLIVAAKDVMDSSLGLQSYSRKEKSLGVLVSNFLRLYNRDGVDSIALDDAAGKLGVERRRIYDVVNILESIGVVARKGKSQYSWNGFADVPRSLEELKEQGMRERFGISSFNNQNKVSNDDNDDEREEESLSLTPDDQENSSLSKTEHKKEKSLWTLSQNFVKMFLCSDDDLITLDDAANALLNDPQDPMHMRTKVRRLYDIANVLSSMNLIEKTQIPGSRKQAYKWLGSKNITEKGSSSLYSSSEAKKKRVFGREITNIRTKRNKTEHCPSNSNRYNKEHDEENTEKEPKLDAKSHVFSPLTPTGETKKKNNVENEIKRGRLYDIETIASTYKPQYCNQEISSLIGHYTEAWKSWYAKLDPK